MIKHFFLKTRGCVVRAINSITGKLGIPPQQDLFSQRQKQIEEADRLALKIDQSNQDKPFLTRLKAAIEAGETIYQMDIGKIHELLKELLKKYKSDR